MTLALTLAATWVIVASVIAMLPRRFHWFGAVGLIGALVPLVPLLWVKTGVLITVGFLCGAGSILRWPLFHYGRRLFCWIFACDKAPGE